MYQREMIKLISDNEAIMEDETKEEEAEKKELMKLSKEALLDLISKETKGFDTLYSYPMATARDRLMTWSKSKLIDYYLENRYK